MEEEKVESGRKLSKTPNKSDTHKEMRLTLINYFSAFEIEKTMLFPHLYEIIEDMAKETIKKIITYLDKDNFYTVSCYFDK